jgi:hypothetical protein
MTKKFSWKPNGFFCKLGEQDFKRKDSWCRQIEQRNYISAMPDHPCLKIFLRWVGKIDGLPNWVDIWNPWNSFRWCHFEEKIPGISSQSNSLPSTQCIWILDKYDYLPELESFQNLSRDWVAWTIWAKSCWSRSTNWR